MNSLPYNTRTDRVEGSSFVTAFYSPINQGIAELIEGYEFSSSSSISSSSESSFLSESSATSRSSSSISSSSRSSLSTESSSISSSSDSSETSVTSFGFTSVSSTSISQLPDGPVYVSAMGDDLNDGRSPLTPKKTIQAGVDITRSGNDVWVDSGTYVLTNPVRISTAIRVRGRAAISTIIDGNNACRCFEISNGATISDLHIKNGLAPDLGGGIACGINARIERCIISNNRCLSTSNDGSAIGVPGGSTVSKLLGSVGGGGVFLQGGNTVINCLLYDNLAEGTVGGGILVNNHQTITSKIINCTICNNTSTGHMGAAGYGPGIFLSGPTRLSPGLPTCFIVNSIVSFNNTGLTGTNQIYSSASGFVFNTSIVNLDHTNYTNLSPNPLLFRNQNARDYHLTSSSGIYVNQGTNAYLYEDSLDLNKKQRVFNLSVDLGAYEYDGTNMFENSYVSSSGNDVNPGTQFLPKRTISGGLGVCLPYGTVFVGPGIYNVSSTINVTDGKTIKGVEWAGNSIVDGGNTTKCFNLSNGVIEKITIQGGNNSGVSLTPPQNPTFGYDWPILRRCIVTANYGSLGGGVNIVSPSGSGSFAILNSCLIYNNSALTKGGGVFYSGAATVAIICCTITNNTYTSLDGGGIFGSPETLDGGIFNSIVYGNRSSSVSGDGFAIVGSNNCIDTLFNAVNNNGISDDPLFTNSAWGNYRVDIFSPTISGGSLLYLYGGDGYDLWGNPRTIIRDAEYKVDMGAYTRVDSGGTPY